MIDEDYDDLFDRIRGNLGEHFSNYMFIVMDDDGDLFYDYTNHRVGPVSYTHLTLPTTPYV